MDYHGIVLSLSQRDRAIFRRLRIIGRRTALLGAVTLYKVSVSPEELEPLVAELQGNMRRGFLGLVRGFYCHFYRQDELVIVFKDRVFRVTTDRASWTEPLAHGREVGIPDKQLDFAPCRVEDERY